MISGLALIWWCFWYFEDKLYCDFERDSLTLVVNANDGHVKCKTYLDAIQKKSKEKYISFPGILQAALDFGSCCCYDKRYETDP